jgi:NADPH:quinone reductase
MGNYVIGVGNYYVIVSPSELGNYMSADTFGANLALDLAVLRTRGTISTYANDGGKPVELNVVQNTVLNTRLQFLVLYTARPEARAGAVEDVAATVRGGALPVGEERRLPLVRFPLDRTADAHRAVESGAVGKVLVEIGG